jgi:hypothetical protein
MVNGSIDKLMKEQGKLEETQSIEQQAAWDFIEATKKLAEAVQVSGTKLQAAKVALIMLETGNKKLHATCKQLADVKEKKE